MTAKTAVALAFVLLVAACGLQAEPQAEVIEAQDVQFGLLGTTTSTTSTTIPESPVFAVLFYWHTASDNRLQVVTKPREERPGPGQTLQELVQGPLEEDLEDNPDLQNLLDPSMEPLLVQVEGGTYQIQIEWPIDEALTTEAAAQFVCTATQFSQVDAVSIVNRSGEQFTLSGTGAVAIPGPARPSDFNDCIVVENTPAETDPDDADPAAETSTTTE